MYYFSCLWLQHTDLLNAYRFFSPVGMVPVIALAGFGLFDRGFPEVGWGSSTENKDYCYPLYQWCCNLGQLTLITALCLCNFITGWTVCGNWCTNVHFICDLFSGMILFLTFNLTFFGPKCELISYVWPVSLLLQWRELWKECYFQTFLSSVS